VRTTVSGEGLEAVRILNDDGFAEERLDGRSGSIRWARQRRRCGGHDLPDLQKCWFTDCGAWEPQ
jgi:hypothetical protein